MTSTVLIAEDDEDVRDLVALRLAAAGYQTVTVNNGNDALTAANFQHPDLVVLDIDMPGLDGLSVCQQLQGMARTSRIPVLILSARGRDLDASYGRSIGASEYMAKPFDSADLVERVGRLLDDARR
ncbi:response regulator [Actinoplanes sp. Pm04-4]|jgi:DNA-binding response OmpR family regulator|uniref:Response regulator n=1 Tax=Paractinoplanes pyxinae TaxID=2997416 RepID=A0ABT4ARA8_9ACTN|nr:response regulator [Actinoplanes pyxinae]MCY1136777.1 response regulator [Actinoplanes pyxinae]